MEKIRYTKHMKNFFLLECTFCMAAYKIITQLAEIVTINYTLYTIQQSTIT
jgi:hypothetical protein